MLTKILIWFTCCIFAFQGLISEPYTSYLEEIINLGRQYRLHPALEAFDEEARQIEILNKVESLLPSYGETNDLVTTIERFIQGERRKLYKVIPAEDCNMGGTTEDPVFFIFDSKQLIYVVKAFKNTAPNRGSFLKELSGLDLLTQLQLKSSFPIPPLAMASCFYKEDHYVLLLEKAALGKRLDQYLITVGKELNTETRLYYLQFALDAITQTGRALAELHGKKSCTKEGIPKLIRDRVLLAEKAIFHHEVILKHLAQEIPLEIFKNYIERTRERAFQLEFFLSYYHGDAHSENLFYDYRTHQACFIDLIHLHDSVSIWNQPISDGLFDLFQLEENIKKLSVNLLTDQETNLLLKCLFKAYTTASKEVPSQEHVALYRNHFRLKRLFSCVDNPEKQDIFAKTLKDFVNEIRLASQQTDSR